MKSTYEALEARLHDTEARLQRTEGLLKSALEEIAKLKQRLNRNSSNSSSPPSTDQKGNTTDTDKPPRASRD